MTVLVGYVPHKGGRGSLDLGMQLAHALGTPLGVVTVVPRQWSTPSLARVDAEYAEFALQLGSRPIQNVPCPAHELVSRRDVVDEARTREEEPLQDRVRPEDTLGRHGLVSAG